MNNLSSRLLLAIALLPVAADACAQVESLTPLSTRPVPQAVQALRKSEGPKTYFIYQNNPQTLPIQDDFSIDRRRNRWAQPGDAGVTLTDTYYYLEAGGSSTWDMAYSSDTTFLYTTDTDLDTTFREALPEVSLQVYDLNVYPPTSTTQSAWPAYNVFDTIQSPSPDILDLTPDLVQDSLLVYTVAPDGATYINPDLSVVPLVLWEDDDVHVNGSYPIDPPTVGVATFDGLARTGYPYDFDHFTSYGIADHLTSVPIDLSGYALSDSLYLSFFYQPQGLSGDEFVQASDSLVLEFYAPDEQTWYRVWRTPYVPLQPFEQILVPVRLARYIKPDFQFRFLNYASLSGSFDHWHLDYVRLGAQRTFDDTRLIDVAYVYPESSLLETYTSVPFNKFSAAPEGYMAQSVTATIRNLDNVDRFITYGMLAKEENAGSPYVFFNGQNTSGNASLAFPSTHPVNSAPNNFEYDETLSTDAAFWRVKLWLDVTPDLNSYNDTTFFIQELSNYYAYDDGSAEMGYGLNLSGAALAYRFDMVGGDSLRAVRMYFNPQANDPQSSPNPPQESFLLTVWSSLDPEVIIHQDFTFSSPEYRLDGIDHFVEYPLDETVWVEGTFYVGWVQTNAVRMNLGFDRNRDNSNKIFFRSSTTFTNTSFQGSLMMRPVFKAAYDPFAGIAEPATGSAELIIYPNPAQELVLVNASVDGVATVQLMDATGRLVKHMNWRAGSPLLVGDLQQGLYVLRLVGEEGRTLAQDRLLIQR